MTTKAETAIKAIRAWQSNRATTLTPTNILVDFGDLILTALGGLTVKIIGYCAYHPHAGYRPDLACHDEQVALCLAMRAIESAAQQGWEIRPIYGQAPARDLEPVLNSIMASINDHTGALISAGQLREKIKKHILELAPQPSNLERDLINALGETYGGPSLSRTEDGTEFVIYQWTDAPVSESILAQGKTLAEVVANFKRQV